MIWRVSPWWFAAALVVPVVPQWIGLLVWSQLAGVPWTAPAPGAYLASWLQITLIGALYFVSEELGWRGFLLPRLLLQQHWLRASVTVGLIWAVWHHPYWTLSSWAMAESWEAIALSLLVSSGRAVALSVIMTWIFQRTRGSVLLAMLFHGSNNANFAKMFDAAGDAALSGPAFLAAQAASAMAFALRSQRCCGFVPAPIERVRLAEAPWRSAGSELITEITRITARRIATGQAANAARCACPVERGGPPHALCVPL